MRITLEPSYILHSRPYRETSLLLEALGRTHGRQRNRAKRRIRGSLAPLMAQIRTGFDLVFIARSTIGSSSAEDLTNAIDSVIRRARILANSGK